MGPLEQDADGPALASDVQGRAVQDAVKARVDAWQILCLQRPAAKMSAFRFNGEGGTAMTTPMQTPPPEFQAPLVGAAAPSDLAAECKNWEKLCTELLAERDKLKLDLAKAQADCDTYLQSLFHLKCKDY